MKKTTLLKTVLFILLIFSPILTMAQIGDVIWEDNFNSFNGDVWTKDVGDGCDQGLCGFGNAELQSYEENNVTIEAIPGEPGNNALAFEARRQNTATRAFTSGKVKSEDKLSVQYGLIEVRMQVPDLNLGLWPAAWLLGTSNLAWPAKGEIDMMEMGHRAEEIARQGHAGTNINNYVGANAIFAAEDGSVASIAYDTGFNQPYVATNSMANRFVTYRLYWEPTQMRYTVIDNGTEYDLYASPLPLDPNGVTGAFNKPFFFLLNLAVGGNFTDAAVNSDVTANLPSKVLIDYVRVYEWNGHGSVETNYRDLQVESGTFGVFTETTPTQNAIDYANDGEIFIWGGTMQEGTETPYEGNEVVSWETLRANDWFGGGILSSFGRDMSNYVDEGTMKFKIKIPANVAFRIGITDNFTNESWLTIGANESKYGLTRNGEWGEVEIPLSDFAGLIAFQDINYMFAISSDPANFPSSTFEFAIDDIVWEDGNGVSTIPVTAVSSTPSSSTLDVDDTLQINANITPSNATNLSVSWTSSNTNVASVNSNGMVTANNPGTATITVTTADGNYTDTTVITVNDTTPPDPTGTNLALGQSTSQSSTAHNGASSRAVDGNTSGVWSQGSVTHTNAGVGQFWEVELQSNADIDNIVVWNRTNCCTNRLGNFTASILNNSGATIWSQQITTTPSPSISITTGGVTGSKVRITQNQNLPLSLAEVQVFGTLTSDDNPVTFVPDPNKTYYIDAPIHNLRLAADGNSENPYSAPIATTGDDVEWVFVAKGNGSWHIRRAAGGSKPGIRTRNNGGEPDMQATSSSGSFTYYDITPSSAINDTYFLTLPDAPGNLRRLQINNSGAIRFVNVNSSGTWESFKITEVTNDNNTNPSNLFIEAEDYTSMNGIQLENTSDTNGGQNVGYIDPNDWLEYNVNIPNSGNYTMSFRVASAPGNAAVNITSNGASIGSFNVDATGGWQSWITLTEVVNLSAGNQNIRLTSLGSGWNINWFEITALNSTALKTSIDDTINEPESITKNEYAIYPVPVQNTLNIRLKEYQKYSRIQIYDVFRSAVFIEKQINNTQSTIDVSTLPKGVYFVKILDQQNNPVLSKKIIK